MAVCEFLGRLLDHQMQIIVCLNNHGRAQVAVMPGKAAICYVDDEHERRQRERPHDHPINGHVN